MAQAPTEATCTSDSQIVFAMILKSSLRYVLILISQFVERRHRADETVSKAIARVPRADLVGVDGIELLPVRALLTRIANDHGLTPRLPGPSSTTGR